MKNKIKHRWLAMLVNAFLQISFGLSIIAFAINFSADLFQINKFVTYRNWTFGTKQEGYKLKATLGLSVPDTVITYPYGQYKIYNEFKESSTFKRSREKDIKREKTAVTVNRFMPIENEEVSLSNKIVIGEPIEIYVNSSNIKHRVFWSVSTQLNLLFSIFFFLLLIKLLNRYYKDIIFEQRTFKLIAGFGWLMIGREVVAFVISFINGKIIGIFYFESLNTMTDKTLENVNLNLNFYNGFTFSNIGVGVLILLLAYVMKEAVVAKNENDLTI